MFRLGDRVYLRLNHNYNLLDKSSKKTLSQQYKPFLIKKRIDRLVYLLKLSSHWRIHPIIFVTQLELSLAFSDSYDRSRSN